MDRLLARKKSSPGLSRGRSDSAASTKSSDQMPKENGVQYQDQRYKTLLEVKGTYMTKAPVGLAMGQSHRLLVTATSGTSAANINGVTIHSACRFSKDTIPRGGRYADVDGFALRSSGGLRIGGQAKMDWQEKYLLIVDEVSMLGARTLYAVNDQLCRLRESREDFGGIPIVLFCGDFHQFRPVQERSILLPSMVFPWNKGNGFTVEQRRQHDKAHGLWNKSKG